MHSIDSISKFVPGGNLQVYHHKTGMKTVFTRTKNCINAIKRS